MSNIIKHRDGLNSFIKSVILKYCPYMEDRLSLLGNAMAPQLDIEISINNDYSQIMFMFGNSNFKTSIPERASIPYIISFEEICEIVDFLLKDHELIKNIDFLNKNLNLQFAINWTDKSVQGVYCGDIGLNLNFEDFEVKKQYLYLLLQRYYTHLEQAPAFKNIKDKFISNMKYSYFDTLDKAELMVLLNEMSESELKELLRNIDNDTFIKYALNDGKQPKPRVLSLEESNHN